MYHSFLIHSFADGHLGCFQNLAIVNCAAINIGEEGFSGTTIKDTWTKPTGRVEVGEEGKFVWGGVGGEGRKCKQL